MYYPSQTSELMYLDKNHEYYYEAYVADGGGTYDLAIGLFAGRTNHANKITKSAVNEKQKITITSTVEPSKQVKQSESVSVSESFFYLKNLH